MPDFVYADGPDLGKLTLARVESVSMPLLVNATILLFLSALGSSTGLSGTLKDRNWVTLPLVTHWLS